MKLTKCLLLLLMLLAIWGVAAAEAETVYVCSGGTGDGSSPEAALSSLSEAFAALPDGGRVIICGRVDVGGEALPATTGSVIITAEDAGVSYQGEGCGLYIAGILELNGEITFEHMQIVAAINKTVWGVPMLLLVMSCGIYLSARLGFFQITKFIFCSAMFLF